MDALTDNKVRHRPTKGVHQEHKNVKDRPFRKKYITPEAALHLPR